jgi:hypothetical protein
MWRKGIFHESRASECETRKVCAPLMGRWGFEREMNVPLGGFHCWSWIWRVFEGWRQKMMFCFGFKLWWKKLVLFLFIFRKINAELLSDFVNNVESNFILFILTDFTAVDNWGTKVCRRGSDRIPRTTNLFCIAALMWIGHAHINGHLSFFW